MSDGDWEDADTSAEEAAVSEAQEYVEEINSKIEETQGKLEKAQEKLKICYARVELARETLFAANQHLENFVFTQQTHLSAIENKVAEAQARLTHAQDALVRYLATNPEVAKFEKMDPLDTIFWANHHAERDS